MPRTFAFLFHCNDKRETGEVSNRVFLRFHICPIFLSHSRSFPDSLSPNKLCQAQERRPENGIGLGADRPASRISSGFRLQHDDHGHRAPETPGGFWCGLIG